MKPFTFFFFTITCTDYYPFNDTNIYTEILFFFFSQSFLVSEISIWRNRNVSINLLCLKKWLDNFNRQVTCVLSRILHASGSIRREITKSFFYLRSKEWGGDSSFFSSTIPGEIDVRKFFDSYDLIREIREEKSGTFTY